MMRLYRWLVRRLVWEWESASLDGLVCYSDAGMLAYVPTQAMIEIGQAAN